MIIMYFCHLLILFHISILLIFLSFIARTAAALYFYRKDKIIGTINLFIYPSSLLFYLLSLFSELAVVRLFEGVREGVGLSLRYGHLLHPDGAAVRDR